MGGSAEGRGEAEWKEAEAAAGESKVADEAETEEEAKTAAVRA